MSENNIQLPVFDRKNYQVIDTTWNEIADEITRLKEMMDSGKELHPNDVKHVQSLAHQVRNYGKSYRRAVNNRASDYKNKLDEKLDELGYNQIEEYVQNKRQQQNKEIDQRLNDKLTRFNDIVNECVDNTKYVKQSSLKSFIANELSSRFPKLNSGAKSKEINHWEPIKAVVNNNLQNVDEQFNNYQILLKLPATSQSIRLLSQYLRTGDMNLLTNLDKALPADKPLLQKMVIRQKVKTDTDAITQINSVMASNIDNETKLKRITMLVNAYHANQMQI